MGICPRCGSFVDEGEPYCPDCSYIFTGSSDDGSDLIEIAGYEFDRNDVEDVLSGRGYDLFDLEHDLIDDDELEEIIDELL